VNNDDDAVIAWTATGTGETIKFIRGLWRQWDDFVRNSYRDEYAAHIREQPTTRSEK